jgi:hypothetical protein
MALYCGMKVQDENHQNPGSSVGGWKGYSDQIMFTNAARAADGNTLTNEIGTPGGIISFNYGLHADLTSMSTEHQSHPCDDDCTGMAARRFEDIKTTIYEFVFPAHSFGLDSFYSGFTFGLGTCINDGDSMAGQGGQGGWSGWAPYGIVHGGKQAQQNGLARLVGDFNAPSTLAKWVPTSDGATAVKIVSAMETNGVTDGPGRNCHSTLTLAVIGCHWLSFLRDSHSNLAVIPVIFRQRRVRYSVAELPGRLPSQRRSHGW